MVVHVGEHLLQESAQIEDECSVAKLYPSRPLTFEELEQIDYEEKV